MNDIIVYEGKIYTKVVDITLKCNDCALVNHPLCSTMKDCNGFVWEELQDKKIPVMLAHLAGEKIETRARNTIRGGWVEIATPEWNWVTFDYRVKPPERKIALFKDEQVMFVDDTPDQISTAEDTQGFISWLK